MGSERPQDDETSRSCASLAKATEVSRAELARPGAPANVSAEQQQPFHLLGRYAHTFREQKYPVTAQAFEHPSLAIRGGSGSTSPDASHPCAQNASAVPLHSNEDLAPVSAPTQPMRRHASGI